MQSAAVADQHATFLNRQKNVGDAAAHGHRIALDIEPVGALHPAFRRDDDHRLRIDAVQHLEPGVVALASDGDDVMSHELEDDADERTTGGLVGGRNHAVRGDSPDEIIRQAAEKHRLEETGVIEEGNQPDLAPRFWRNIAHPSEVVAVENLAQVLEHHEHGEHRNAAQELHAGRG